jgi:hypothetical protein
LRGEEVGGVSIPQQALIQYAGMAIAFMLGWLAHWHGRDHEAAACPHHGWDQMRGQAVSWLREIPINGTPRMQCSYCGKVFPAQLAPSAWSSGSGSREQM